MIIDGHKIVQVDGAVLYRSGLVVDADGSPNAYRPGGGGLDYLSNALVDPHDDLHNPVSGWAGILTDNGEPTGKPLLQGANDPVPGNYISTTAATDPTWPPRTQRHYLNSEEVSFISVPHPLHREMSCGTFDLAVVMLHAGPPRGSIVGDVGPSKKVGEGSIALARRLGIPAHPKRGGVGSGVYTIIFPNSASRPPWPRRPVEIEEMAFRRLTAWGGLDRLHALLDA